MKNIKIHHIVKFVGIGLAVIALIFLALPGVTGTKEVAGVPVAMYITLSSFIFGNGTTRISAAGHLAPTRYVGGMSYFAFIALFLLLIGIAVGVLSIFKKKSSMTYAAAGILVLAGISMFLLKVAGSESTPTLVEGVTESFSQFLADTTLGVGTILFGIFAILSGGCIGVSKLLEPRKKD